MPLDRWLMSEEAKLSELPPDVPPPPAAVTPPMLPLSGPLKRAANITALEVHLIKGMRVQLSHDENEVMSTACKLFLGYDDGFVVFWVPSNDAQPRRLALSRVSDIRYSSDDTRIALEIDNASCDESECLFMQPSSVEELDDMYQILDSAWKAQPLVHRHTRNDSAGDFLKLDAGLEQRGDLNRVNFADRFQVEAEQRAIEDAASAQPQDAEMKRRLQQRMSRCSQTMKPISVAGRGRGIKRGSSVRSHYTSSSDQSIDLEPNDHMLPMGDDDESAGPRTIRPHNLQP